MQSCFIYFSEWHDMMRGAGSGFKFDTCAFHTYLLESRKMSIRTLEFSRSAPLPTKHSEMKAYKDVGLGPSPDVQRSKLCVCFQLNMIRSQCLAMA